jgi:hypothetical protein
MRSPKYLFILLLAGSAHADIDGYLIGGGIETDSDEGFRGSLIAAVGLSDDTWLSGGFSASSVELASGRSSDAIYGDIELDHHFDPMGFTIGAAYWGDPDLFDSVDLRGSVYYRNNRFSLAGEYEYRDFDLIIPPTQFFPGREVAFDADGIGARVRYKFTDTFSMSASAMKYDYSVDFRPDENRDVAGLRTVSRLSLINNLVESRASLDFALDVGSQRWELDVSTWNSVVDQSRTKSVTINYLRPLSNRTEIEFGLGYDDSDLYGDVTFVSIYLYFYAS